MNKKGSTQVTDDEALNRGDSFRKVLPTTPSTSLDSRLTMSGRMIERPSAGVEKSAKFYAPYIQEYCLWAELKKLYQGFTSTPQTRIHFRLAFDSKLYHPAVSVDTGDLNVAAEFRTWRRGHNHVWQILQYAKDAFDKVATSVPLNTEAAALLENDPDAFQVKAKECAVQCKADVFDVLKFEDDINYIRFEPFNKHVHGTVFSQLKLKNLLDT